jgi:hypothetical protein
MEEMGTQLRRDTQAFLYHFLPGEVAAGEFLDQDAAHFDTCC